MQEGSSGTTTGRDAFALLPTLEQYNAHLNELLAVGPVACGKEMESMTMLAKKQRDLDKDYRFIYAQPLTISSYDAREEFSSIINLLIDRHSDDFCRRKLLLFLIELSFVESTRENINRYNHAFTATTPAKPISFGFHAFKTIVDVLPAIPNLTKIFVDCIEMSLNGEDIFEKMSINHAISILPLLLQLVKNPFGEPEKFHMCRLFVPSFLPLLSDLLSTIKRSSKKINKSATVGRELFAIDQLLEILAIVSQNETVAQEIFGCNIHKIVFDDYRLLLERMERSESEMGGLFFGPLRLIGSLCHNHAATADFFAATQTANSGSFLGLLISQFHRPPDRSDGCVWNAADGTEGQFDSKLVRQYAEGMICLEGLLFNSDHACAIFQRIQDSRQSRAEDLHLAPFVIELVEVFMSHSPDLTVCCFSILRLLTHRSPLYRYRSWMEKHLDVAKILQKFMRKILQMDDAVYAKALVEVIKLTTYYNQDTLISQRLSRSTFSGFDRDSILFRILCAPFGDPLLNTEVKLAAAECLSTINLSDLDTKQLQTLVTIFSSLPETGPDKMYRVMCVLTFFLCRISVEGTSLGGSIGTHDKVPKDSVGNIFRSMYATEITLTMFGWISGTSNVIFDLELNYWKRMFHLSCVKLLHLGWSCPELRPLNDPKDQTSEKPAAALIEVMVNEQRLLSSLLKDREDLHRQGRCVICKHILPEPEVGHFFGDSRFLCSKCLSDKSEEASRHLSVPEGSMEPEKNCIQESILLDKILEMQFKPMFLEQTWIGFDVKYLMAALQRLQGIDAIVFRCLHSLANVLENRPSIEALGELQEAIRDGNFEMWNSQMSGKDVPECELEEMGDWTMRAEAAAHARQKYNPTCQIADDSDASELALLQLGASNSSKLEIAQAEQRWRDLLAQSKNDSRHVTLVLRDFSIEPPTIVAFCGGGPSRSATENRKATAQLYGIFISEKVSTDERDGTGRTLLKNFSAYMFRKGYKNCIAEVRYIDRSYFFGRPGVTFVSANPPAARQPSMSVFQWDVRRNPWSELDAHVEFLEMKGVSTLLSFVEQGLMMERDAICRGFNFTSFQSTIRDVMEVLGSELIAMDSNRRSLSENGKMQNAFKQNGCSLHDQMTTCFKNFSKDASIGGAYVNNYRMLPTGGLEEGIFEEIATAPCLTPYPNPDNARGEPRPTKRATREQQIKSKEYCDDDQNDKTHNAVYASLASVLRALWTVVTQGSPEATRQCLHAVHSVETLDQFLRIMRSLNYGIRTLAQDAALPDKFQICAKMFKLLQRVHELPVIGVQQSLDALERIEVCAQMVLDVFDILSQLIKSRASANPLHPRSQLHPYEEDIMQRSCEAYLQLLISVEKIIFFPSVVSSKQRMIVKGNRSCIDKALSTIFYRPGLVQAIEVFLMYDCENQAAAESQSTTAEFTRCDIRTKTRVCVASILSTLFRVEKDYKNHFIEKYLSSRTQTAKSYRPSMVRSIVEEMNFEQFRVQLEELLWLETPDMFSVGESIVSVHHVDHAEMNSSKAGKSRILVVTTRCYYLSKHIFPKIGEVRISIEDVSDRRFMRRELSSIVHIRRCASLQLFALTFRGPENSLRTDIVKTPKLGDATRLSLLLESAARDDMNRPLRTALTCSVHHCFQNTDNQKRCCELHQENSGQEVQSALASYVRVKIKNRWTDRILDWIQASDSLTVRSFSLPQWGTPQFSMEEESFILDKLQSLTFSENTESRMILTFDSGILDVQFYCDAAREKWRNRLKHHVHRNIKASEGWSESVLPGTTASRNNAQIL